MDLFELRMPLKAIDFFCGAGGMSFGLAQAGIKILAGIDCDASCQLTYEKNNKPAKFINSDIRKLSPKDLAHELNVGSRDDGLILVGCTPCQFWTKINTDRTRSGFISVGA